MKKDQTEIKFEDNFRHEKTKLYATFKFKKARETNQEKLIGISKWF